MTEGFSRPQTPEIAHEIFDEMADSGDGFAAHVRRHYAHLCFYCGYEPVLSPSRVDDAWISFRRDKKHAAHSMPGGGAPDHFKLCGILVYWLRRFAPVYDLRDLNMAYRAHPALSELLKKYPSELPAFDFGMTVCDFFERHRKENASGVPAVGECDNFDYHESVCYLMKFKNLSPHSLGMIYRSLYVPVGPAAR